MTFFSTVWIRPTQGWGWTVPANEIRPSSPAGTVATVHRSAFQNIDHQMGVLPTVLQLKPINLPPTTINLAFWKFKALLLFLRPSSKCNDDPPQKNNLLILPFVKNYRVFFLTGAPLKVQSVRLQSKSYQKSYKCQNLLTDWHLGF